MDLEVVATLQGVREYAEEYPVALVRGEETGGRLAIRAENEGGCNHTLVGLWDLIEWARRGPPEVRVDGGFCLPFDAAHARDGEETT